jgi:cation diffusion facilitator CzcD-associated flavoprotein CzcO
VVGAGPAGLQLAYLLHQAHRDYVVLERAASAGAFFQRFPIHRRLISINPRFTGNADADDNLRHDWNSLLADDRMPRFTNYTAKFWPDADTLVRYLQDCAQTYGLNVAYNTTVERIQPLGVTLPCDSDAADAANSGSCPAATAGMKPHICTAKHTAGGASRWTCRLPDPPPPHHFAGRYRLDLLRATHGAGSAPSPQALACDVVILATGHSTPFQLPLPNGTGLTPCSEAPTTPEAYAGQNILILGKGNSAFEVATTASEAANFVHLISRSRAR